jgi:hypothetical protein
MFKLLFGVLLLIALGLVAGAYWQFDPSWPILGILMLGVLTLAWISRGEPALPPGGKHPHWGSGHGIYFDPDDVWVVGSDSEDFGGSDKDDGSRR